MTLTTLQTSIPSASTTPTKSVYDLPHLASSVGGLHPTPCFSKLREHAARISIQLATQRCWHAIIRRCTCTVLRVHFFRLHCRFMRCVLPRVGELQLPWYAKVFIAP